jgi:hypothetical protein
LLSSTALDEEAKPLVQVADHSGWIEGGSTLRDTVLVLGAKRVAFLQAGTDGGVGLAIVDPTGLRLSAADSTSGLVRYEGSSEAGLQSLTVSDPAPGRWIVESVGSGLAQEYAIGALVQADSILSAQVTNLDQDGLLVRSAYFGPAGPLQGAEITAVLYRPDSTTASAVLLDDGVHGDSLASDGIFGAVFLDEAKSGVYGVRVEGRLMNDGREYAQQEAQATAVIQPLPDLTIDPSSLLITRAAGAADTFRVAIALRNLAAIGASGALIQFQEASGPPFTTVTTDVDPHGEVHVSVGWRPNHPDSTSLSIFVDRASPFLQSRYDNDSLAAVLRPSTVSVGHVEVPAMVMLGSAAPNPARGATRITFAIAVASHVRINIYDLAGRHVTSLLDAEQQPGAHSVEWNGTAKGMPLASGVYFYELETNGRRLTRRVVLLR